MSNWIDRFLGMLVFWKSAPPERAVTEIRDHFVFTDVGGPFCLDDGAWNCHAESGVRLRDDSLAACALAVRLDKERRRKLSSADPVKTPVQP